MGLEQRDEQHPTTYEGVLALAQDATNQVLGPARTSWEKKEDEEYLECTFKPVRAMLTSLA